MEGNIELSINQTFIEAFLFAIDRGIGYVTAERGR